jgi:leukotriene-A4 hydrolase
MLLQA